MNVQKACSSMQVARLSYVGSGNKRPCFYWPGDSVQSSKAQLTYSLQMQQRLLSANLVPPAEIAAFVNGLRMGIDGERLNDTEPLIAAFAGVPLEDRKVDVFSPQLGGAPKKAKKAVEAPLVRLRATHRSAEPSIFLRHSLLANAPLSAHPRARPSPPLCAARNGF